MTAYEIVRNDPNYPEPLDPEIIPLCDALNNAGFPTTASCCGHGCDWPRVWFSISDNEAADNLARFIIQAERKASKFHFTSFLRETLAEGYEWKMEIHLTDVFSETPQSDALKKAEASIRWVAKMVREWRQKHWHDEAEITSP